MPLLFSSSISGLSVDIRGMSNDLSSTALVVCDGSLASFTALMAEALAGGGVGGGGANRGEKRVLAWTRRAWGEACVRAVARQVELVQSRAEIEHPEASFTTKLIVNEGACGLLAAGGMGSEAGVGGAGRPALTEGEALRRAMAENDMLLAAGSAGLRLGLPQVGEADGGWGAVSRLVWAVQLGGSGVEAERKLGDPLHVERVLRGISDAADRALLLSRLLAMDSESVFNGRYGAGRFVIQTPYVELTDEQMVELALDMDVPLGEIVPGPGEAADRWLKVIRAAGAGGLVGGVRGAA